MTKPPMLITRAVYDDRRTQLEQSLLVAANAGEDGPAARKRVITRGFCLTTYNILNPPDVSSVPQLVQHRSHGTWARTVQAAVQKQEEKRWQAAQEEAWEGGKTEWYASLQPRWGRPPWLATSNTNTSGDDIDTAAVVQATQPPTSSLSLPLYPSSSTMVSHGEEGGGTSEWCVRAPRLIGRRWRTRLRCSSGVPLAAAEREQRRMSSKAGRASALTSRAEIEAVGG